MCHLRRVWREMDEVSGTAWATYTECRGEWTREGTRRGRGEVKRGSGRKVKNKER